MRDAVTLQITKFSKQSAALSYLYQLLDQPLRQVFWAELATSCLAYSRQAAEQPCLILQEIDRQY